MTRVAVVAERQGKAGRVSKGRGEERPGGPEPARAAFGVYRAWTQGEFLNYRTYC